MTSASPEAARSSATALTSATGSVKTRPSVADGASLDGVAWVTAPITAKLTPSRSNSS